MNDKNLWFKRRRYGYGWTPVTWQGWATFILFIGSIIAGAFLLFNPSAADVVWFFTIVVLAITALVGVSLAKGPVPKWRWGKKPTDNSHHDF